MHKRTTGERDDTLGEDYQFIQQQHLQTHLLSRWRRGSGSGLINDPSHHVLVRCVLLNAECVFFYVILHCSLVYMLYILLKGWIKLFRYWINLESTEREVRGICLTSPLSRPLKPRRQSCWGRLLRCLQSHLATSQVLLCPVRETTMRKRGEKK